MEIAFHKLALCLSGYQPHVRVGIPVNQGFSSIGKDLNLHGNSCSVNGNLHSDSSQEMLEVDF
jgi:hypothetical protein